MDVHQNPFNRNIRFVVFNELELDVTVNLHFLMIRPEHAGDEKCRVFVVDNEDAYNRYQKPKCRSRNVVQSIILTNNLKKT